MDGTKNTYSLENLQQLGLSPYEARAYLALLRHGKLLGKEVAQKAGVPPTSVYRNLESLRAKGFVQIIQKNPFAYQAVEPEAAVSGYLQEEHARLDELKRDAIADLTAIKAFREIEKKEDVLEVYAGREQAYIIGNKLICAAKREFLLLGRGTKQSILDVIHALQAAGKKGVSCRYIITTYDENRELVEQLKGVGVKIRYLPLQNFSLLVRDREESMIAIKDESKNKSADRIVLRIKSRDLSEAHAAYFDTVWKKATLV